MRIPILQIVIFQLLFLAIYDLFLHKETFFNWNRWYLLITPILSIAIPFIKIPLMSSIMPEYSVLHLPEILINTKQIETKSVSTSYSYVELFFMIGVIISTFIFIRKLLIIFNLIVNNKRIKKEGYNLVVLPYKRNAFSFFNYIFIGNTSTKKEYESIINHELVHCKSNHSIDLVVFEILKIIMWFNPLVYLFQKRIQLLHEYIADEKVLQTTKQKHYFNHLLSEVFEVTNISFINQFYKQSFLKKRIMMATKNKSKQVRKVKYLVVIPLVLSMLFYVSCNDVNQAKSSENDEIIEVIENNTKIQKRTAGDLEEVHEVEEIIEDMPFALIEKAPVFPGCEGSESGLKKCFEEKIKKHIAKEFNKNLAGNLGLSSGMKRISVLFKIDKTGNIVNVRSRAPHKALQDEAIRVIKTLPKMIPGKYEGKNIGVMYSVPIVFKVE